MPQVQSNTQPNILFLFSDEHNHRFLGTDQPNAESVVTPALDGLIKSGTWFRHAYCQMPLCTPSRICLLTGREVRGSGGWKNESVLRPELPTIPTVLKCAGYETCLVGKMHLGGSEQSGGFDHRPYGDLTGKTGHQWEPIDDSEFANSLRGRTAAVGVTGIPESLLQDQVVATESIAWIREHVAESPTTPWMLCASFSRPHFPLTAPERWIEYYRRRGVSEPFAAAAGDAYDHPMSVGMRVGFKANEVPHDEMMKARSAYFACVSYLDEVIGDLLGTLERSGFLENTIVVYTADHGEMAGDHGVWWKNGWYEGCTRVPLIIQVPAGPGGNVVDTPVALVDLLPTLARLAGAEIPDGIDGRDLSDAITGAGLTASPVHIDNLVPRWGPGTEFRATRFKNYKYVRFRDAEPLLFDVIADPAEQVNLLTSVKAPDEASILREHADSTMDFDKAEQERTDRDDELDALYPLTPLSGTRNDYRNCYELPDGRIVAADDTIYAPRIASEKP